MASQNLEIATRLRDFCDKNFSSKSEFARALGLRPQELHNYLNARSKPGPKLQSKLREIGADVEWIMTGRKKGLNQDDLRPVYATVPAGKGSIVNEPAAVYDYAPPDSNDNGKGYWLKVKGDSMYPALKDGQLVFVNPEREVHDNDLAVVVWNDHEEGAIKQVHFTDSEVILSSINLLYKPLVIHRKKISMIARICFIKL